MVKIYELVSGQLCLYVGKTSMPLSLRVNAHRSKSNKCHSKYIPDYTDWEIKLIEECDDALATEREQYWYDTKKPLYNKIRPGNTQAELDAARPLRDRKAYNREYWQREYVKEKDRNRKRLR
jgi:hypothetical protein